MTRLFALLAMTVSLVGASTASATHREPSKASNQKWMTRWVHSDESIYPAINRAASIFNVSTWTLRTIVEREGGNINPRKLKYSLCHATQPGWNLSGSYAFGPFQFMLDSKNDQCGSHWGKNWGTFGSYASTAFLTAKKLGHPVPYRFLHPASNVGQAITAAYMIAHGGLHHWCASMC